MQVKESIDNYRSAIERLAKNNSELVFDNSGVEHAGIVLSTIFKNSKDIVRIYANDMNGDISMQKCYQNSINSYLSSGGKLQIILDDKGSVSRTIKEICSNPNVETKLSSQEFRKNVSLISDSGVLYHFAVGDNKMFRVELDSDSHKAVCSFNLPGTSKVLIDLFDLYFKKLPQAYIS